MFERTAILLLASGLSSRFETGDKLLAPLSGRTVLDHAADALSGASPAARIAVVGVGQDARRAALEARGFDIVINPEPARGQGHSLALGAARVRDMTQAETLLILLADMPNVSDSHLTNLAAAHANGAQAVMTRTGDVLCPPALFARASFDALACLNGDQGARSVFFSCDQRTTVETTPDEVMDIDCIADLRRMETQ
ncbi:MAG: nucleotidyltransferase family protein [Hyphomonas sp.]|nr:nucleotidyltransferase family protein [Hyphomonas sp.]